MNAIPTEPFKVAVAQIASNPTDTEASIRKVADTMLKAAAENARLIVFPEAVIGGYPKGASFGAPIGVRKPEGREAFAQYFESAVDLNSEALDPLIDACAETGIVAVVGVIERGGATLYCTALYIDGAKGIVGKHRKLMPTAGERLIWGFGDGSTLEAVQTDLGVVGAVICWENYMPALRMHMFDQGVTLYCAPTADDRDSWLPSMRHIALEGRCYVLTACQYITRAAYSEAHESALGDSPETVMMRGGSAIVSPLGEVLAGPDFDSETLLYAYVEPGKVAEGKFDFDVTGHYARPDVFALHVNTALRNAVTATPWGERDNAL
ncbi:carbon-nitrogen hydrolase family protein [Sulfitobacter sp. KE34]|uniref:carbon-nitrogen hydrolase family protein n=1 Tax=unclassified Sulfitobacter TaxID=196795 RepID=UPI0023E29789|nr:MULTISPECIES: carbon-nitrogen hydrolase family protein [unclassified Sulfitobacter]MDF3352027.1 carbon-nitrogen hydrolase family protein [Sulfitobacter sp. KE12]MDF3355716.1 carbon-nitrogen hydrolase family protein [Sulfitobacter sp. KE27]MDF3359273.1 carbon-nitrogen hydrolase family protein [Sulfitobacter sp. KE33]MDF3366663.1 carbon-nitrogen hydrolase family protein [Sulfitobacter sp. Ks34]MDF3370397.1 carbon-nitrogen hydrolase family protein [Sulfitobacter sp. Ks43]